jgi:protein-S-isoprenylcysteine O-methyltransferase Ste14
VKTSEVPDSSPVEFRYRSSIAFIIYFAGFSAGFAIDHALGGHGVATYVLIGRIWGDAGVRVTAAVAGVLAVAGFFIRWWGSSYHKVGVVFSDRIETQALTADGPYRYVRNPLYLGNLLQGLAISALGPPAATLIILAGLTALLYRLIGLEEAGLRASFKERYERYCASVPRLIPRIVPASLAQTGQRPNILYGFWTELGSLGFAIWIGYLAFVNPDERSKTFIQLFYLAIVMWIVSGILNRRMSGAAQARK